MEDISNRCRQIEERVKNLMDKKREDKEQRNPNVPYQVDRKYVVERKVSRERDNSIHSNRSRNNSISRNNSYRSIEMDKYSNKKQ